MVDRMTLRILFVYFFLALCLHPHDAEDQAAPRPRLGPRPRSHAGPLCPARRIYVSRHIQARRERPLALAPGLGTPRRCFPPRATR